MVHLSPSHILMEFNNNGYFDRIDEPNHLPETISVTDNSIDEPKLEPKIEDATNLYKFINRGENIVYVLDDFSNTFSVSLSDLSGQPISFPGEPLKICDNTADCDNCDNCPPSTQRVATSRGSASTNNPCELNKLLKVDVVSPDSFGSSHQSITENLSIDSVQSNQTMNSAAASNSSDLCVICSDFATGKHYGVSACEGCKGFFKRTIRKNLNYSCRDRNTCPITERLRNRCQSCRFQKCLDKGMKIQAVQKERTLKHKLRPPANNVDQPIPTITAEDILQNEMFFYHIERSYCETAKPTEVRQTKLFCSVINKQLFNLVMWAKSVPGFSSLERSDQMILLNRSWVELLIASFSYRSSIEPEIGSIKMDDNHRLSLSVAPELGLQNLTIRILRELIITFKRLQVDQMEMACLKTIILFDPNHANIHNIELVKRFRYRIFDILKVYVSHKYPKQPYRIYKLLLKLPSVRGLTSCFIERMQTILFDSFTSDDRCPPSSSVAQTNSKDVENQSKPDLLYPLFSEMMKQKHFPYL